MSAEQHEPVTVTMLAEQHHEIERLRRLLDAREVEVRLLRELLMTARRDARKAKRGVRTLGRCVDWLLAGRPR